MKKIIIFLSILSVIFAVRYYWSFSQQKTKQEQQAELQELQKNSGASFVNYRYTVKEPENPDFEFDSSQINYSESQEKTWQILKKADYKFENGLYKPVFYPAQYQLDSTEVTLEGFMIPMEESTEQSFFLLSYYPYSMCFFCGKAEPQTVIEVYSKVPLSFKNERITVRGMLKLNESNPNQLFYVMENVSVLN